MFGESRGWLTASLGFTLDSGREQKQMAEEHCIWLMMMCIASFSIRPLISDCLSRDEGELKEAIVS